MASLPANQDEDFTVATIVAPSAMKSEEEEAAAEGEVPTVEGEEAAKAAKPKARAKSKPSSTRNFRTARWKRRAVSFCPSLTLGGAHATLGRPR